MQLKGGQQVTLTPDRPLAGLTMFVIDRTQSVPSL
jgi:hypothetical protein